MKSHLSHKLTKSSCSGNGSLTNQSCQMFRIDPSNYLPNCERILSWSSIFFKSGSDAKLPSCPSCPLCHWQVRWQHTFSMKDTRNINMHQSHENLENHEDCDACNEEAEKNLENSLINDDFPDNHISSSGKSNNKIENGFHNVVEVNTNKTVEKTSRRIKSMAHFFYLLHAAKYDHQAGFTSPRNGVGLLDTNQRIDNELNLNYKASYTSKNESSILDSLLLANKGLDLRKKRKRKHSIVNPSRIIHKLLHEYVNASRQSPISVSFEVWIKSSTFWNCNLPLSTIIKMQPQWGKDAFHKWYWTNIILPNILADINEDSSVSSLESNKKSLSVFGMPLSRNIINHLLSKIKSFEHIYAAYYIQDSKFYNYFSNSFLLFLKDFMFDNQLSLSEVLYMVHESNLWNSLTFSDYNLFSMKIIQLLEECLHINVAMDISQKASYWNNISRRELLQVVKSVSNVLLDPTFRIKLLSTVYPSEYFESIEKLPDENNDAIVHDFNVKKSTQQVLLRQLRYLFPHEELIEGHQFNSSLELDGVSNIHAHAYFPRLNLVVQYFGEQHFIDIQSFPHLISYRHHDNVVEKYFERNGLLYLTVPYWWNLQAEQLASRIIEKFPQFQHYLVNAEFTFDPIPDTYNHTPCQRSSTLYWDWKSDIKGYFYRPIISGIKSIITVSFSKHSEGIETHINFYTQRNRKSIAIPDSYRASIRKFVASLPSKEDSYEFKGVLFSCQDGMSFSSLSGMIRSGDTSNDIWKHLQFQIERISTSAGNVSKYDASHSNGRKDITLINTIQKNLSPENKFMKLAQWRLVHSKDEIISSLESEDSPGFVLLSPSGNEVEILAVRAIKEEALFVSRSKNGKKFSVLRRDGTPLSVFVLTDHYNESLQSMRNVVTILYTDRHPSTNLPLRATVCKINSKTADESTFLCHRKSPENTKKEELTFLSVFTSLHEEAHIHALDLEDQVNMIKNAMIKSGNSYPSQTERNEIATLLNIDPKDTSKLFILAREKKRFPGMMKDASLHEKRKFVQNWIALHGENPIDSQHILALQTETGLQRKTIQNLIRYMRDKKGTVTEKKKEVICKYLIDKEQSKLSSKDITHLQKLTSLSRSQIHKQLSILVNKMEYNKIEKNHNTLIRNWLVANNYRTPTSNEYDDLQSQTRLSRQQLYSLVSRLKDFKGTMTPSKIKIISSEFNALQTKNEEELSDLIGRLQASLQLSRKQIYDVINRIKKPLGEITEEKRKAIHEVWLKYTEEGNLKTIPKSTLEELELKLHLSRTQIRSIIRNFTPRGKVTKEVKEYIEMWLLDHNGKPIDWEFLSKETQLSRTQLHGLVSKLRDQRGILTMDKKDFLSKWLQEHSHKKPTPIQISELQKELLLSRSQIQEYIKKILDPPAKLTEEIHEYANNIFQDENQLTEEMIHKIQKHTQISRRQVHYLWRKYNKSTK